MVRALDANPGRWDLSSLVIMTSSGVMWSEPVKQGLLAPQPEHAADRRLLVVGGHRPRARRCRRRRRRPTRPSSPWARTPGSSPTTAATSSPARARPGGSRSRATSPIGYYKDPEKSAATFVTIDGDTYSIPGDYARVEADGTLTLLGRGSVCINTGGEKVFPEEVEEILKEHPTVHDAVVVGLPDEKFGEAITAVVQAAPGATARRRRADRLGEEPAGLVQGARSGWSPSTPSAAAPTARSTTSA